MKKDYQEEKDEAGNLSMFSDLLDDSDDQEYLQVMDDPTVLDDEGDDLIPNQKVVSPEGYREVSKDLLDDVPFEDEDGNLSEIILDALKARGFNPDSIKFENDNGEIEEFKFSELSREDQVAILSTHEVESDELSESEMEAIEFLRENNMSISSLAAAIKENVLAELNNQEKSYTVDDFSDDELFIADFRNKYGEDFSDEELLTELDKAKENSELFSKKMNKLRNDYKSYEEEEFAEKERIANAAREEEYNNYVSTVVNAARSISDVHDTVELDDDDKRDILSFVFDADTVGKTGIQKALEDPSTLFRVAWYIKHGDDVFKETHKYYQSKISELSKASKKVESVVKTNKNQHTTKNRPTRLEDLF